jgi:hypothetical protein
MRAREIISTTYQVCDDLTDALHTCQWQAAFIENFVFSVLVDMIHKNDNFGALWVRDKIHSATHAFHDLPWNHIISEVTSRGNFQRL